MTIVEAPALAHPRPFGSHPGSNARAQCVVGRPEKAGWRCPWVAKWPLPARL